MRSAAFVSNWKPPNWARQGIPQPDWQPSWLPGLVFVTVVVYVVVMTARGYSPEAALGVVLLAASAAGEVLRRLLWRPREQQ
jgi:hypothetical protein